MGLRCISQGPKNTCCLCLYQKSVSFVLTFPEFHQKNLFSCLFGETCQNWIQFPVTMRLLWGRSLRVPVLTWLGTFCYRCVSDQEQGNSCNKGTPKADHVLLPTTVNSSSSSEISTINQKKKKKKMWNHVIHLNHLNGTPTRVVRSAKWRGQWGRNSGSLPGITF